MFKNKLFMIIIAMLIVITLILVAFFALWTFMDKNNNKATDPATAAKTSVTAVEGKKLTAAEVKELTVPVKDLTTNLAQGGIVRLSLAFELDNKKAKTEFENLDFKVKGIVNQTLADMNAEQIQGAKGQENLISVLMNKINEIMNDGKVKQIWITDIIVQ